jgi:hypothetical protein
MCTATSKDLNINHQEIIFCFTDSKYTACTCCCRIAVNKSLLGLYQLDKDGDGGLDGEVSLGLCIKQRNFEDIDLSQYSMYIGVIGLFLCF